MAVTLISLSATAQEITIPYRKGNLWGLCDTNAKIIVEPQYSKILYFNRSTNFPTGGYYVHQNRRVGMLVDNKLMVPTEYISLSKYRQFIQAKKGDGRSNNYYILNSKGQIILKNIQRIYRYKSHRFSQTYNRYNKDYFIYTRLIGGYLYQSLIWADKKGNIKRTILKDKRSISHINRQNQIIVYDFDDNKIQYACEFKKEGLELKMLNKKKVNIDNSSNEIFEVESEEKPEIAMPPMDRENKKYYYTYYSLEGKKLYEHTGEGNEKSKKEKKLVSKNCGQCKLMNYNPSAKYQKLGRADGKTYFAKNYTLTRKNKKYGIVSKLFTLQPTYRSIKTLVNKTHKPPTYSVQGAKKNSKEIGILKSNGEWLVPLTNQYDAISPSLQDNYYTIIKNDKYGLLSPEGIEVLPARYDTLQRIGYLKYGIKQNNKWGLYQGKRIVLQPILDDMPTQLKYFYKRYKTYKVMNEQNKFLGYANERGLKYYEN